MRTTTASKLCTKTGSVSFTFGPFAVGDIWESFTIALTGLGPALGGTVATATIQAGAGSAKSDHAFTQSAACEVPGTFCLTHHLHLPVWQKIEPGNNYLSISVDCAGFGIDLTITAGVAVRPAWKIPGVRGKLTTGLSILESR